MQTPNEILPAIRSLQHKGREFLPYGRSTPEFTFPWRHQTSPSRGISYAQFYYRNYE